MTEISETRFNEAYDILESSFIPAELKPREVLRLQHSKGEVLILGFEDDKKLAAVITLWEFADFVFVENFAVDIKHRGKGIGGQLLQKVIEKFRYKRIILEVEPPENEIQKRRISFYEINGFTLSPFCYTQPPLRNGCENIELVIMHTGNRLTCDEFEAIKNDVFKTVYKCKLKG